MQHPGQPAPGTPPGRPSMTAPDADGEPGRVADHDPDRDPDRDPGRDPQRDPHRDPNRSRGALLGLAVGDAVGTTLEFKSPGSFDPIDDMVGGGPFALQPGQWTDDTSMALCLGHSLLARAGFDPADQARRYLRWWEEGYLSSTGRCFDIGGTVSRALGHFRRTGEPYAGSTDRHSAGNGCLMRMAPVPIFYAADLAAVADRAADSARVTHGAAECVEASRLFAVLLARLLRGEDDDRRLVLDDEAAAAVGPLTQPRIAALARGEWRARERHEVRGSGYVVESLEAALWCFHRAGDFREAVLLAANLGDDADTTAAIAGQLAGARWGADGIPHHWRRQLHLGVEIDVLASDLHRLGTERARHGPAAATG